MLGYYPEPHRHWPAGLGGDDLPRQRRQLGSHRTVARTHIDQSAERAAHK
jgi:hypothetical protein